MCFSSDPAAARRGDYMTNNNQVPGDRGRDYSHIRQEVIDCLIASRAAYELTTKGINSVLKRHYALETSDLDLILRNEQSSFGSIWENQVFVMVRSSAGYIMVACRGTFSLSDVIADVKVAKLPVSFAKGRAQIGFVERALNLPLDLFISLLRAGERIIFTGHSLGGAVTSLAALRVLEAIASVPGHLCIAQEQVRCITFGTAPFANLELADYVNLHYKQNFHHIVSKHDVVPRAHNVLPHFFFPVAKWLVDRLRSRWEVRTCKHMIETMTKMPVDKVVLKLEEKVPSLWPATWFYNFLRNCAAYDEEALFYGHVGYLLLLDPDTKDPQSIIMMDEMESLGTNFCLEGKSPLEIYYEHGLGNHYSCLVRGLKMNTATNVGHVETDHHKEQQLSTGCEFREPAPGSCCCSNKEDSFSMHQMLRNPSHACFTEFHKLLLRVTGNDFPCPQN